MKTALLLFLLGVSLGAIGFYYYGRLRPAGAEAAPAAAVSTAPAKPAGDAAASGTAKPSVMDQARDTATAARDAIAQKLVEWKLTPADIREELAQTSRIVREKAGAAGAAISAGVANARIIAVIKAKYTLDRELGPAGIGVDCDAGKVTLTGTLSDPALVGRAITLALETDGVREVVSLLTVPAPGAEPDKKEAPDKK